MSIWEGLLPADLDELEAGVELIELPLQGSGSAGALDEQSVGLQTMVMPEPLKFDGNPKSLRFDKFYYLAKVAD